jgi:hypothetical protein
MILGVLWRLGCAGLVAAESEGFCWGDFEQAVS